MQEAVCSCARKKLVQVYSDIRRHYIKSSSSSGLIPRGNNWLENSERMRREYKNELSKLSKEVCNNPIDIDQ